MMSAERLVNYKETEPTKIELGPDFLGQLKAKSQGLVIQFPKISQDLYSYFEGLENDVFNPELENLQTLENNKEEIRQRQQKEEFLAKRITVSSSELHQFRTQIEEDQEALLKRDKVVGKPNEKIIEGDATLLWRKVIEEFENKGETFYGELFRKILRGRLPVGKHPLEGKIAINRLMVEAREAELLSLGKEIGGIRQEAEQIKAVDKSIETGFWEKFYNWVIDNYKRVAISSLVLSEKNQKEIRQRFLLRVISHPKKGELVSYALRNLEAGTELPEYQQRKFDDWLELFLPELPKKEWVNANEGQKATMVDRILSSKNLHDFSRLFSSAKSHEIKNDYQAFMNYYLDYWLALQKGQDTPKPPRPYFLEGLYLPSKVEASPILEKAKELNFSIQINGGVFGNHQIDEVIKALREKFPLETSIYENDKLGRFLSEVLPKAVFEPQNMGGRSIKTLKTEGKEWRLRGPRKLRLTFILDKDKEVPLVKITRAGKRTDDFYNDVA